MFTDLAKDWTAGPPSDYYHFIPMLYAVELEMHHFELNMYANDHNIIDKPLIQDENGDLFRSILIQRAAHCHIFPSCSLQPWLLFAGHISNTRLKSHQTPFSPRLQQSHSMSKHLMFLSVFPYLAGTRTPCMHPRKGTTLQMQGSSVWMAHIGTLQMSEETILSSSS